MRRSGLIVVRATPDNQNEWLIAEGGDMNRRPDLRTAILELLRHSDEPLKAADICQQLDAATPTAVGQVLRYMYRDGLVVSRAKSGAPHEWSLPPTGDAVPVTVQPERTSVPVPDYQKRRPGRKVTVYAQVFELQAVVQLWLKGRDLGWFKVPIWGGDLRIDQGHETPLWHVDQETWRGIQAFKVVKRDGSVEEFPHNPDRPLTIAPVDE
jgi:hypothetical protein